MKKISSRASILILTFTLVVVTLIMLQRTLDLNMQIKYLTQAVGDCSRQCRANKNAIDSIGEWRIVKRK